MIPYGPTDGHPLNKPWASAEQALGITAGNECPIIRFILGTIISISNKHSKKTSWRMPASTFANGEIKEFKEVREVKAICFTDRYSTQKAVGYNF